MKLDLELHPCGLILTEREATVGEFLTLAAGQPGNVWLIAESPREFVFRPFAGTLEQELQKEAISLIVFGQQAEARLEKAWGADQGWLRLAAPAPAGGECLRRRIGALLRDGSGRRLIFEEYYRPDESGFLVKICSRLGGVEAS